MNIAQSLVSLWEVLTTLTAMLGACSILLGEDTHPKDPESKSYAAKVAGFSKAVVSTQPANVVVEEGDVPYAAPELMNKVRPTCWQCRHPLE